MHHLFLYGVRLGRGWGGWGECPRDWFGKRGEDFSHHRFISGPVYKVKCKVCLFNLLLGDSTDGHLEDLKEQVSGVGSVEAVEVFKGMVAGRKKIEYAYRKLVNSIMTSSRACVVFLKRA